MQAGQVVKVLDHGPYRESLDVKDLPEDTGLVSEAGTVLEATDWKYYWTEPELKRDQFAGHKFFYVNGFRISGLTMSFPPAADKCTAGILVERADGMLIEKCRVGQGPTLVL